MSDTISGFTVVLKKGVSEYEAKKIKEAFELFPFVASVSMKVESHEAYFMFERAKNKFWEAFFEAMGKVNPS